MPLLRRSSHTNQTRSRTSLPRRAIPVLGCLSTSPRSRIHALLRNLVGHALGHTFP